MINFKNDNINFSVRSAGILIDNGRVLVQRKRGDNCWALPGGRVELGEQSNETLPREFEEEIGVSGITVQRLLYVAETFFKFKGENHHQISFYYLLNSQKDFKYSTVESFDGLEKEKNIEYSWVDLNKINQFSIKPDFLKDELLNIQPYVKHIIEYQ